MAQLSIHVASDLVQGGMVGRPVARAQALAAGKKFKILQVDKDRRIPSVLHPLVCSSQPLPNQTTRTTPTPRFAQFSAHLRTSNLANFSSHLSVRRNCCRRFPVRFLPDVFCALPNPATLKTPPLLDPAGRDQALSSHTQPQSWLPTRVWRIFRTVSAIPPSSAFPFLFTPLALLLLPPSRDGPCALRGSHRLWAAGSPRPSSPGTTQQPPACHTLPLPLLQPNQR